MSHNSFLNSVIRGFGSQIGRDSAKVLTNSMYGNAHATPYRNTSSEIEVDLNSHYEKLTDADIALLNSSNINEWCNTYSCTYQRVGSNRINYIKYCFIWFVLIGLNLLGFIIALYKGYKHYNLKKKMNQEQYIIEHPFIEEYNVIDNRTKTGFKTNKRKNVEYYTLDVYENSTEDYIKKEKKLGLIYFIVSIFALSVFILPSNSDANNIDNINTTELIDTTVVDTTVVDTSKVNNDIEVENSQKMKVKYNYKSIRCKAITHKGTRCSRKNQYDGYCWQHRR